MFMMKKNLKIRSKKILFGKIHQVSTLWATSWQIHPQWNFSKLDLFWFNFKLAILGESKDWKAESILKALLGFSTVPLESKQGAEHSLPSICTRLPKLWNMQQWDWNCFHLLASLPCRCVGLYDQGFVGLWSRCDGSGPTLPCFPCKGCRSRPTCCLVTVAFHIQLLNMSHKTNQRLSENIKVWCVERAGKLWDYSNFWNLAILIGSAVSLSPYYYFEVFLCQQLLQSEVQRPILNFIRWLNRLPTTCLSFQETFRGRAWQYGRTAQPCSVGSSAWHLVDGVGGCRKRSKITDFSKQSHNHCFSMFFNCCWEFDPFHSIIP